MVWKRWPHTFGASIIDNWIGDGAAEGLHHIGRESGVLGGVLGGAGCGAGASDGGGARRCGCGWWSRRIGAFIFQCSKA